MQEKKRIKEREERKQARKSGRRKRANVEDDEESIIEGSDDPDGNEPDIEENENDVIKPAARSGPYSTCRKAKLGKFAEHITW